MVGGEARQARMTWRKLEHMAQGDEEGLGDEEGSGLKITL